MPHLVPVVLCQSCDLVYREKVGVWKRDRTGKDFLRREVVVESSLRLMPIVAKAIPLAPGLDIHVQPVVEDHGPVWMVCHTVLAGSTSESWFCG
jgi:hypothetical protein